STFVDLSPPTSHASSPTYSASTTITVSYTASDVGSGLDKVELWAKAPGAASYSKFATDSSPGASGSFSYSASSDGTYSFYTVAVDKAGNSEAAPAGADTTTLLDTAVPSSSASSPQYSASTTISVGYTASDSGSGLDNVELWAKVPGGSFSYVATDTTPGSSGSFNYTA